MSLFTNDAINMPLLKQRAYNFRWAEVDEGIIPLTAADPDFPSAPEIREAIIEYAKGGYFSYTPKLGFPELCEAFAKSVVARKGEAVHPGLVLPIDSAARGMYVIAQTLLQPGDEMIVFDPVDYLFREACLAAGGHPVLFSARLNAEGRIDLTDLEKCITPRTRIIGLCNPHNPFGSLYSREDLEHIMTLAEKHKLYIMNDEIWSDIVYSDARFTSILSLGPERCRRVASVYGFSKSFGIAGLRAGCVYCADEALFKRIVDKSAVMTTAGGISSLSQVAAIACLEKCWYWVDSFLKRLEENRNRAAERVNRIPGLSTRRPDATYLLYINIEPLGMSAVDFCNYLKNEVKLALVSGGDEFFGPGSRGHVRLCFATSPEILDAGLERLEQGVSQLCRKG
jgi:cystathionine beta-lyase